MAKSATLLFAASFSREPHQISKQKEKQNQSVSLFYFTDQVPNFSQFSTRKVGGLVVGALLYKQDISGMLA